MGDLVAAAEAEVRARHDFFVAWFTGRADAEALAETARAFAPDFTMLWPDMGQDGRDSLMDKLRAAKGTSPASYAIRIEIVSARQVDAETVVLICDEHQTGGASPNSRRMSAVFSRNDAAPHGVVWRHLHQSWLPQDKAPTDGPAQG